MNADSITIETDEDGFRLRIHGSQLYIFRITDPEALYDTVKREIGPWLYERDMAKSAAESFAQREVVGSGYDLSDPKSVGYHDRMAAIWDERSGK